MSHHLITGGAGFIGSALAHRLIAEGEQVTILDRFSRGKMHRVPDGSRTIAGDIRHPEVVWNALQGVDTIWHLAYVQGTQTFYADPKDVIDVALRGIMNVLAAVRRPRHPPGAVPRVDVRGLPEPAGRDVPDRRDRATVGAGRDEPPLLATAAGRSRRSSRPSRTRSRRPQPGGDRPAAQHLRPGHGERARDPRVRAPDDAVAPATSSRSREPVRRPAASATSTTASTASWSCTTTA